MFTFVWRDNGVVTAKYCHWKLQKNFIFSRKQSPNKKQYKPLLKDPLLKVDHIM